MVASFQGRQPRIITNKLNQETLKTIKDAGRTPDAFYDRGYNRKIYIVDLTSKVDLVKSIIHEGWDAYIDDFLKGKVTL